MFIQNRERGANVDGRKKIIIFTIISFILGLLLGIIMGKCPSTEQQPEIAKEEKELMKEGIMKPKEAKPKIFIEEKEVEPLKMEERKIEKKEEESFVQKATEALPSEITCYSISVSPQFLLAPKKFWNKRSAEFIFSPGIILTCKIQDYQFPCGVVSPRLRFDFREDGEKNFRVLINDAGFKICNNEILEYSFVVDTTPPITEIIPEDFIDIIKETSATFSFRVNEPVEYTLCRLDDGFWLDCSSGKISLTNLEDGWHKIQVYSVDLAGNEEMVKEYVFRVDARPPTTVILYAPSRVTNSAQAVFEFDSDEEDVTFECNLDGAGWVQCSSPFTISELKPGLHILQIRGIDSYGRIEPEPTMYSWTVVEGELVGDVEPFIPPKRDKKNNK